MKKYYVVTIFIVNMIIDLFEEKNMSENYIKELNEILNWLKRNMIPPRYYSIKGINMYREEKVYYQPMDESFKKDFDKVETIKTKKKNR